MPWYRIISREPLTGKERRTELSFPNDEKAAKEYENLLEIAKSASGVERHLLVPRKIERIDVYEVTTDITPNADVENRGMLTAESDVG